MIFIIWFVCHLCAQQNLTTKISTQRQQCLGSNPQSKFDMSDSLRRWRTNIKWWYSLFTIQQKTKKRYLSLCIAAARCCHGHRCLWMIIIIWIWCVPLILSSSFVCIRKKKKNARYYIPLFIFSYSSFSGFADPFWHFSLFLISSDEIFYCVILYVHAYGTDGSIPIELFLSERWNGPWVLPWPWEPCDIFICAHGHLWNVNKRFHSSFRLQQCGCRPRTKKKGEILYSQYRIAGTRISHPTYHTDSEMQTPAALADDHIKTNRRKRRRTATEIDR